MLTVAAVTARHFGGPHAPFRNSPVHPENGRTRSSHARAPLTHALLSRTLSSHARSPLTHALTLTRSPLTHALLSRTLSSHVSRAVTAEPLVHQDLVPAVKAFEAPKGNVSISAGMYPQVLGQMKTGWDEDGAHERQEGQWK